MRSSIAFLSVLLAAGCASTRAVETTRSSPATTIVQTAEGTYDLQMFPETRVASHWVSVSREDLWRLLPAVYSELGISPGTVNPEEWVFGNRDVRVRRIAGERPAKFLDCGKNPIGAPIANTSALHLGVTTSLEGTGNGTEVTTRLVARARPPSGGATEVLCTSTGELERHIAQRLGELAASEAEGAGSR
jgi:hypothetical protein